MHSQDCCQSFLDRCRDKFREGGLRLTEARRNLSQCLEDMNGPFSSKELHQKLVDMGTQDIDLATVYRNLQTYADLDLIHRLPQNGRFIKCNSEHICLSKSVHVIFRCEECQAVEEAQLDQDLVGSVFFMTRHLREGFEPKSTVLEQSGRCENCQRSSHH